MSGTGEMEESPAVNSLQSSLALGPKVPRLIPKSQKLAQKIYTRKAKSLLYDFFYSLESIFKNSIKLLGLFLYAKKLPIRPNMLTVNDWWTKLLLQYLQGSTALILIKHIIPTINQTVHLLYDFYDELSWAA